MKSVVRISRRGKVRDVSRRCLATVPAIASATLPAVPRRAAATERENMLTLFSTRVAAILVGNLGNLLRLRCNPRRCLLVA